MNERTIRADFFENTILNRIIENNDKAFILKIWIRSADKETYTLNENLNDTQKSELYNILAKLGYKSNPIKEFPFFKAEVQKRYLIEYSSRIAKLEVENRLQEEKIQQERRRTNALLGILESKRQGAEDEQQTKKALFEQILYFREQFFPTLIKFMTIETFVLFAIVITTSIPVFHWNVDQTTLQILVGATIAQISAMIIIMIKSVFPDSINKILGSTRLSEEKEKEKEKEEQEIILKISQKLKNLINK